MRKSIQWQRLFVVTRPVQLLWAALAVLSVLAYQNCSDPTLLGQNQCGSSGLTSKSHSKMRSSEGLSSHSVFAKVFSMKELTSKRQILPAPLTWQGDAVFASKDGLKTKDEHLFEFSDWPHQALLLVARSGRESLLLVLIEPREVLVVDLKSQESGPQKHRSRLDLKQQINLSVSPQFVTNESGDWSVQLETQGGDLVFLKSDGVAKVHEASFSADKNDQILFSEVNKKIDQLRAKGGFNDGKDPFGSSSGSDSSSSSSESECSSYENSQSGPAGTGGSSDPRLGDSGSRGGFGNPGSGGAPGVGEGGSGMPGANPGSGGGSQPGSGGSGPVNGRPDPTSCGENRPNGSRYWVALGVETDKGCPPMSTGNREAYYEQEKEYQCIRGVSTPTGNIRRSRLLAEFGRCYWDCPAGRVLPPGNTVQKDATSGGAAIESVHHNEFASVSCSDVLGSASGTRVTFRCRDGKWYRIGGLNCTE